MICQCKECFSCKASRKIYSQGSAESIFFLGMNKKPGNDFSRVGNEKATRRIAKLDIKMRERAKGFFSTAQF